MPLNALSKLVGRLSKSERSSKDLTPLFAKRASQSATALELTLALYSLSVQALAGQTT